MNFVNNNNNHMKKNNALPAPSEVKRGGDGAAPSAPVATVSTVATDGWVPGAGYPAPGERRELWRIDDDDDDDERTSRHTHTRCLS